MMTDEFSEVGFSKEPPTSADEAAWGLASFGLGALSLLIAPIILMFNLLLWQAPGSGPNSRLIIGILSVLGISMMLGLSGCSIGFGLKGRRVARSVSPLVFAGILVGMAASVGWIMVAIQLIMILN
jgi:hypothetical protein